MFRWNLCFRPQSSNRWIACVLVPYDEAPSINIRDLPDLKQQIDDLKATIATKSPTVPLYWLLGAAIGALVVGYLAGHLLLARRVRKQFGGLRVY